MPNSKLEIKGIEFERSSFNKSLKSAIHKLPSIVSPPVPNNIFSSKNNGDIYVSFESGTTALFSIFPDIASKIIMCPGGLSVSIASKE